MAPGPVTTGSSAATTRRWPFADQGRATAGGARSTEEQSTRYRHYCPSLLPSDNRNRFSISSRSSWIMVCVTGSIASIAVKDSLAGLAQAEQQSSFPRVQRKLTLEVFGLFVVGVLPQPIGQVSRLLDESRCHGSQPDAAGRRRP